MKKKKNEELDTKIENLENQLRRAVADYANLQRRFEEEKKEVIKFANTDLLIRLIPAFDTLFLAEKFVVNEGIKLTIKKLEDSLRELGVMRVKTVGEAFDPSFMEAVETVEGEDDEVIEEVTPGFSLYGKLLRAAQVKVGKKV